MNQYLYPWYDQYTLQIGVIRAKSYNDAWDKLIKSLIAKYNKLDDTLERNDLLDQLEELYGIYIGDIYDINEL